MKKLIITIIALFISSLALLNAQSKQTQKELFAATYHNSKTLVETQQFQFVGQTVYDGDKRERLDNDTNILDISKTTISGQLSSLNSDNKIFEIKGEIENYKVIFNDDKQQILIEFSVNKVAYNIEVKPNGYAFFTISSTTNSAITWIGQLKN